MRKQTAYEKWLMDKSSSVNPKVAIDIFVDQLLTETNQIKFPINLSSVAKSIGINPIPLYQNQLFEGGLLIYENKLRISLKTKNNKPPTSSSYNLPRMRFTYAHELIHCIGFNISESLPMRIAPKPNGREEEHLCNYGACRLLLPPNILREHFVKTDDNITDKIIDVANNAKVSVHAVILQLFAYNILPVKKNSIYILSSLSKGFQSRNEEKIRCLASVLYDEYGQKLDFLKSYEGIEHLKSRKEEKKEDWSLLEFHNIMKNNQGILEYRVENEIIERLDKKSILFRVSGIHKKIKESKYIWSELIIHKE